MPISLFLNNRYFVSSALYALLSSECVCVGVWVLLLRWFCVFTIGIVAIISKLDVHMCVIVRLYMVRLHGHVRVYAIRLCVYKITISMQRLNFCRLPHNWTLPQTTTSIQMHNSTLVHTKTHAHTPKY